MWLAARSASAVVFSAIRQLRMVLQETAKSTAKGSSKATTVASAAVVGAAACAPMLVGRRSLACCERQGPITDVEVSYLDQEPGIDGDRIASAREPFMQRTEGAIPVFRVPLAPRRSQPVVHPHACSSSPAVRGATILIELRPDFQNMAEGTFVTDDNLAPLGSRIRQSRQSLDLPRAASAT